MLKVKIVKNVRVVVPSVAERDSIKIVDAAKERDMDVKVFEEDYFMLKFLDLYSKLEDVEIEYEYEGEVYKDLYEIDNLKIFEIFDKIFELDVKVMKKK